MSAHTYLDNHRKAVDMALGLSLVLYGGSFSTSMTFVHALGPSLPALNNSVTELKETYLATRTAFDDELPTLLKTKENALKLEKDVKSKAYKDAEYEIRSLRSGGNAVSHVFNAIDPVNCKKIFGSLYRTAVVGFAAMQNENVGLINMGVNSGNIVFKRLQEVGSSLQSKLSQNAVINQKPSWNEASLNLLVQGLSISIAYKFKQTAPIVSAVIVGSQMCTNAFDEFMAPITSKLPETIRARSKALVQGGLIYYGCFSQLTMPTAVIVPSPLNPLLGFENMLTKAILKR